jgi:hypothetical protein
LFYIFINFITPLNDFIENFSKIPVIPRTTVKDAASEIINLILEK